MDFGDCCQICHLRPRTLCFRMWAVDRGGNLVLLVCYWVDSENFTGNSGIDIGDGCDIYSDDYDIGEISKVKRVSRFFDYSTCLF